MGTYGIDKPDSRISLTVQDATDCMADCGFVPFAGQTVKAVAVSGSYTITEIAAMADCGQNPQSLMGIKSRFQRLT